MTAKEWLEKTLPEAKEIGGYGRYYRDNRPRAVCADGFSVSIQGNTNSHYCSPRDVSYGGVPYEVELGYPSTSDPLIANYAEDKDRPTGTVYGYVPIDIVEELIAKHGGITGGIK